MYTYKNRGTLQKNIKRQITSVNLIKTNSCKLQFSAYINVKRHNNHIQVLKLSIRMNTATFRSVTHKKIIDKLHSN